MPPADPARLTKLLGRLLQREGGQAPELLKLLARTSGEEENALLEVADALFQRGSKYRGLKVPAAGGPLTGMAPLEQAAGASLLGNRTLNAEAQANLSIQRLFGSYQKVLKDPNASESAKQYASSMMKRLQEEVKGAAGETLGVARLSGEALDAAPFVGPHPDGGSFTVTPGVLERSARKRVSPKGYQPENDYGSTYESLASRAPRRGVEEFGAVSAIDDVPVEAQVGVINAYEVYKKGLKTELRAMAKRLDDAGAPVPAEWATSWKHYLAGINKSAAQAKASKSRMFHGKRELDFYDEAIVAFGKNADRYDRRTLRQFSNMKATMGDAYKAGAEDALSLPNIPKYQGTEAPNIRPGIMEQLDTLKLQQSNAEAHINSLEKKLQKTKSPEVRDKIQTAIDDLSVEVQDLMDQIGELEVPRTQEALDLTNFKRYQRNLHKEPKVGRKSAMDNRNQLNQDLLRNPGKTQGLLGWAPTPPGEGFQEYLQQIAEKAVNQGRPGRLGGPGMKPGAGYLPTAQVPSAIRKPIKARHLGGGL